MRNPDPERKKAIERRKQRLFAWLEEELAAYHERVRFLSRSPDESAPPRAFVVLEWRRRALERLTGAISRLLDSLPDDRRRFVELKYFQQKSYVAIAAALYVAPRTLFRWREEILSTLALYLGLLELEGEAGREMAQVDRSTASPSGHVGLDA